MAKKITKRPPAKIKHKPSKEVKVTKKPVIEKVHPKIEVNEDWCKGCYICVEICPKGVFGKSTRLSKIGVYPAKAERQAQCILCRDCEIHCPDLAITVSEGE